jgi:hypothetical protein
VSDAGPITRAAFAAAAGPRPGTPAVNLCSDCRHRHIWDAPTTGLPHGKLIPCGKHPDAFLREARKWCEGNQWEPRT